MCRTRETDRRFEAPFYIKPNEHPKQRNGTAHGTQISSFFGSGQLILPIVVPTSTTAAAAAGFVARRRTLKRYYFPILLTPSVAIIPALRILVVDRRSDLPNIGVCSNFGKMSEEMTGRDYEPAVINKDLLVRLAIEQGAKGEAQRLFIHDGVRLEETEEIRIEFLNILKIDNLWIMSERLTRLKLSNNVIEKIENLDSLVNLRELDLSFNHIRIIENLDCLVKLEILLLYENEITEIGGIDRSTELTILSIGSNKIEQWDHVMYLRKFPKLRVFNVAGNECTRKDGYSKYLVAFLPQIEYFNYKMIEDEEREIANEEYQRKIASLLEKESVEKAEMEEKRRSDERLALLSISYVEYLDGDELFEQMFKHDREGKELSVINDDTRAAYEEYKKIFTGLCFQLYEIGLREHERRKKETELFTRIVDEGREAILMEARTTMEKILERRAEIFGKITKLVENVTVLKDGVDVEPEIDEEKQIAEARRLSEEFSSLLSNTWTRLMHREVILHEQIEDTNETFKLNMGDMASNFSEAAQAIFSQMRYAETEYKDNIDGIVNLYINGFTDQQKMPSRHVELCGDRDVLSNSLSASHDIHLQTIDAREDVIVSRLKSWYDGYTDQLAQEESQRNRRQILEISHFLEHQREQFDVLQLQLQYGITGTGATSFDADVVAAMEG